MESDDKHRDGNGSGSERNASILLALDPLHRSLLNHNLLYEGKCAVICSLLFSYSFASSDKSCLITLELFACVNKQMNDVPRDETHRMHVALNGNSCFDLSRRNLFFLFSSQSECDLFNSFPTERRHPIRRAATASDDTGDYVDGDEDDDDEYFSSKSSIDSECENGDLSSIDDSTTSHRNVPTMMKEKLPTSFQSANGRASIETQELRRRSLDKCSRRRSLSRERMHNVCDLHTSNHRNVTSKERSDGDSDHSSSHSAETEATSSEYSDTNLLIQNMKNRECEMFQKICFNNGYYATSSSDTNSGVDAMHSTTCRKCSTCGLPTEKSGRKRRSLPTTMPTRDASVMATTTTRCQPKITNLTASKSKTIGRKNSYANEKTSSVELKNKQSRKITITIRTKNVDSSDASGRESGNTRKSLNYHNNLSANELVDSEYASALNATIDSTEIESKVDAQDAEDEATFCSVQSDSKCNSERSQYFDCIEDSDATNKTTRSDFTKYSSSMNSLNSNVRTKSQDKVQSKKRLQLSESRSSDGRSMICIVQEMTSDRTVTSRVEIDREKVREFKKSQRKHRPKIIADSFCDEVLSETNKLSSVNEAKTFVLNLEKAASEENEDVAMKISNRKRNFVGPDFAPILLTSSPKSAGKSINRLLAQQRTLTSMRRSTLKKVAAEILITEEKQAQRTKKWEELPPIKPPRSFTASSSSSPQSKQSFETTTTLPLEELDQPQKYAIGFVVPEMAERRNDNERTHIGWIRPDSSARNAVDNLYENPLHLTAAVAHEVVPKEDIDTVDSVCAREFESFSADLEVENRRANLSTPIKDKSHNETYFTTAENERFERSSTKIVQPSSTVENKKCINCHGTIKKKTPGFLSAKNGRRLGKAALKRTKTLIDSSKQLLKKPPKATTKCTCCSEHRQTTEKVQTPIKTADETVRMNSETFCSHDAYKRVDKSLNLTPAGKQAEPSVALNPSPKRLAPRFDEKMQKKQQTEPTADQDTSATYVTPQTSFNFERKIESPRDERRSGKASPSRFVTKLNQIAKNSRTLFRQGKSNGQNDRPLERQESKHYYQSFGSNDADNKVPLMGERLQFIRTKLESDAESEQRAPSARKSLFRERTLSTSSGDLLENSIAERIAEIQLHDEPEPLYAEVNQKMLAPITNRDSEHSDEVDSATTQSKAAPKIDEISIENRKYLMVNDDPKTLYATVDRNRKNSCSSYGSSLNMSSIGDLAQSVQEMIEQHEIKMQRIYSGTSDNGGKDDEDSAADDFSSGCSSFYRRNRELVATEENKRWQDFMDSLSFCTVKSESYCDTASAKYEILGEMKRTINTLEADEPLNCSDEMSFDSREEQNKCEELMASASRNNETDNSILVSFPAQRDSIQRRNLIFFSISLL